MVSREYRWSLNKKTISTLPEESHSLFSISSSRIRKRSSSFTSLKFVSVKYTFRNIIRVFTFLILPSLVAAINTMNIFKKKTSPKEALRTSKREMAVATRGIEREIASLQLEEKKLVAEIKKTAKTGNEASATRILARQLVRLRQQITNLQGSRAQIRGVTTHTQALYASTSISTGMKGASKAMVAMNKQMAPTKQVKVIKEFQKQSAQMDMTIEMMSEAIDETLDKDEAEEATEELTNQVLDEIGVDIASQLSSAPKGRIASKSAPNSTVIRYALTLLKSEETLLQTYCRIKFFASLFEFNFYIAVMQSQLVCSGCRSILLYPRGATNVCCAVCNTVTSVPPPGMEMAQLICGGCRTLLMYTRGATSVRCSCCHTVNLAPASNQVAHVNCGHCRMALMYPYGAPSVKCAVCHYVTNVGTANVRVPLPVNRPNGAASSGWMPSTSTSQTVVVENPMSVDESGKLVSNVVVGVTTDKK
ncbi:LOW QUALITY PROTEIN: Snf7 domain-containing protein/zf-LSD1 domain-containing protein [Cephalotus follicularis]|uniref:Snf7 domain-containing protein/zf-LSD1 domain-containing protein n=1 Tax=Cephalotus follicularis TaxID=3775 RepID=A0A1Q3ANC0_CEPFO|nr:LOW QUALITY PROTEIN: Snf7 domain-containing protein/zf-LSD1 domain-containing protein [Cephalotus follicularis]